MKGDGVKLYFVETKVLVAILTICVVYAFYHSICRPSGKILGDVLLRVRRLQI